jgi:WD40 repeat protein
MADGRSVLASGGDDARVLLWDPDTGSRIGNPISQHVGAVRAVAFGRMADGRSVLASGGDDARVLLWDPDTGSRIENPFTQQHTGPVLAVAIGQLADGRLALASGGHDSRVLLCALGSAEQSEVALTGHTGSVRALAFTLRANDQLILVSAGDDATVRLWDTDTRADPPDSRRPYQLALYRLATSKPTALSAMLQTLFVGCGDGIVALTTGGLSGK